MSKTQNNYYIANKYTKDIVYPYGNGEEDRYRKTEEGVLLIHKNENGGVTERLLSEDEFPLSEFDRIKAISDEDYRERNRKDMIERKHTVSIANLDEASAAAQIKSAEDEYFDSLEEDDDYRYIENAFRIINECLSEVQKKRYVDYYYRGKTLQKIAEEEGTSSVAIWKSIKVAKKNIANFLFEHYDLG